MASHHTFSTLDIDTFGMVDYIASHQT